ncbi:hypothetical protein OS122_26525 [Mycolicibacterium mucogenicum]|uniref:hypothetical protein n=1 Tax=Mycolicibacterium mucogenicum TaxID=56689 RepID=UPI00226A7CD0|nr:hypothetical protein [Mycolicibacterium mucogenicum]MCX8564445.1 hypothetical protein [Mycolicibacterium mucogenicum]
MSASSSTDLPSPIPLKGSAAFITDGGSAANSPSRTDWLQLLPASRSAEGLSRRRRRQPLTFASRVDAFSLNLQTSAMRTAVRRAIDIASQAFGWVDITVACAARDYFAPAETITAEGFRTMIDIDLPDPMVAFVDHSKSEIEEPRTGASARSRRYNSATGEYAVSDRYRPPQSAMAQGSAVAQTRVPDDVTSVVSTTSGYRRAAQAADTFRDWTC